MTNLFRSLISSPSVRAYILAAVRHGVTYGGGILSTYLISKGASANGTAALVEGLSGVAMAATSIMFSFMDVQKVGEKITAVAAAPTTPAETLADLKAGKFG